MKAQLYLESLDGRIVPDATPTTPTTNPPLVAQPPEAPWTAEEVANLRAAVNQLEQWGNEAGAYYTQIATYLSAQQDNIDWLEAQTTALASGQQPIPGQPPAVPQLPAQLREFVQLFQQVRDLPGEPLQKAIALTQEANFLTKEASKAAALSKQMSDHAAESLRAMANTADEDEQGRLLNAAIDATAQSLYFANQAQQMTDFVTYKLDTLRTPHMQQLKAFLSDK